jgi:hypothetical protein
MARAYRHAVAPEAPAKIVPFPVKATAAAGPAPGKRRSRPSLGVNIALAIILALACLLWEAASMPAGALVDLGHVAITSPRALLDAVRAFAGHGLA